MSGITVNAAVSGGTIISDGGADIIARGVCWSWLDNPTTADQSTNEGPGSDSYTSNITGLKPGKNYYVRAYATNSVGIQYGQSISFCTLGSSPEISDVKALYIGLYGATLYGTVNTGDLPTLVVFEYGLTDTYGSQAVPTPYPINENTPVGISVPVNYLKPGTKYHYRMKSENELGVSYSGDYTFTTLGEKPRFSTISCSFLTSSAKFEIDINSNMLPISVSVEYGLTESLGTFVTSADSPLPANTAKIVIINLSELTPGKQYYFRVILTNDAGSSGTFIESFNTFNVLDIDNNGYYSVIIGTQEWLTSNLRTTRFSNGDPIPNVITGWNSQSTAAYCFYNNQKSNIPSEGNLYNYYVVSDARKVCPSGWHVPSKEDGQP